MGSWTGRVVILLLSPAAAALVAGCGGGEPGSRYPLSEIDPPEYVDIELCAAISSDGPDDDAADRACQECCHGGDFSHYSPALESRCVCGNLPLRPSNDAVCDEAGADEMRCGQCCVEQGFSRFDLDGGGCTCQGVLDRESCGDLSDEPQPALACEVCCIEHGYLSLTLHEEPSSVYCTCRG